MATGGEKMPQPEEIRAIRVQDLSQNHCGICREKEAKYRCPKCQLPYCSMVCYKDCKHNTCSEKFYKDCVMSELQDMKCSSEVREKTLEILRRENDRRSLDLVEQPDSCSLDARMAGVNLDDYDDVWSRLTDEERQTFKSQVGNSDLMDKLIPVWAPWWTKQEPLIIDVEDQDREFQPEIIRDVPQLNKLLGKTSPSPFLRYNVVNVLLAYTLVCRHHNGDHHDEAVDAVQTLFSICCSLKGNVIFESLESSIHSVLKKAEEETLVTAANAETLEWSVTDVLRLLQGRDCAAAALSDVHRMLDAASKEIVGKDDIKQLIKSAKRKIIFYLSWLHDYNSRLAHVLPQLQEFLGKTHFEADLLKADNII